MDILHNVCALPNQIRCSVSKYSLNGYHTLTIPFHVLGRSGSWITVGFFLFVCLFVCFLFNIASDHVLFFVLFFVSLKDS